MLRYTVLRLGIFFGCLLVFWLVGIRNDQVLLLLLSAAVSVVLSYFLLRRQRDEFAEKIATKVERRQASRRRVTVEEGSDEQVEDAELEADPPHPHPHSHPQTRPDSRP